MFLHLLSAAPPMVPSFVSQCLGSVPTRIQVLVGLYVAAEVAFYVAFHWWLLPRANHLKRYPKAPTYRDYPSIQQRHELLLRILRRLQRQPEPLRHVVQSFLLRWFVRVPCSDNDDATGTRQRLGARNDSLEKDVCPPSTAASENYFSIQAGTPPPSVVVAESDASSVDSGSRHSGRAVAECGNPSACEAINSCIDDPNTEPDPTEKPQSPPEPWIVEGLDSEHVDDLFSWAFFGTSMEELRRVNNEEAQQMRCELHKMHQIIRDQVGLRFVGDDDDGDGTEAKGAAIRSCYVARQMTLEPVNALHRPLLVYAGVALLQKCANLVLRCVGFRRVVSNATGLVGWYREAEAASEEASTRHPPLLFFHGIAPAGHAFYLPMVLNGLAKASNDEGQQAVYIFENPHISCSLSTVLQDDGKALTERETIRGVQEILELTMGKEKAISAPLALVGHSFGSVPLTWLLHSHFQPRIASMLLIDPVTILLSEPDVMTNFLYNMDVSKIRMLASSELGIQVYLRRHFAWYNAELWLQEVPTHVAVGVALSEHDEILNAPKVRAELQHHHVPHLYWRHVGHARCVSSPSMWKQLRDLMAGATKSLKDESEIRAHCKKYE
jgi:pimeloyl-ACP methyl ester carboxylesterase